MGRRWIWPVTRRQCSSKSRLDVYRRTRKCDAVGYGLLWAASRLYALDSSDDVVCARRVGNVLAGPFVDDWVTKASHEIRQGFEGCLLILEPLRKQ